jgi:predicted protein tyrosine phosphatase
MLTIHQQDHLRNKYQGLYPKALCICFSGLLRSPTLAHMLAANHNRNTRSAGVYENALIPVTERLLFWADEIWVVDEDATLEVPLLLENYRLRRTIYFLEVEDNYDFMQPDLKEELTKQIHRKLYNG